MNGPNDAYQRFVLIVLQGKANSKGTVAISPLEIAKLTSLHEKSVRKVLRRLEEEHWISSIGSNAWEVTSPTRARTRAIDPPFRGDNPLNQNKDANNGYTPLPTYDRARARQRGNEERPNWQSLGEDNCPHCEGSGWMEVDPVANGHPAGNYTVDVCTCRGGPTPKATSVYPPPAPPSAGLTPEQMMTNLIGVDDARKKLRNEEEA